ncbi:MAG: hypothetical protein GKC53_02295 [Neisseriaceae bacterium]|nr:MAG: hypothetical protein GKC53_02295 [Neisseriaceae bacterium]
MLSDEVVLILHEYGLVITEDIFNYLWDHAEIANSFNNYVLSHQEESLVRIRFYSLKRSSDDYFIERSKRKIQEQAYQQSLSMLDCKQGVSLECNANIPKLIHHRSSDSEVSMLNLNFKSDAIVSKFTTPSVKIDRATVYSRDVWSKRSSFLSVLSGVKNSNKLKEKIKLVICNNPTIPFEDLFNPFLIDKYTKKYGEERYLNALDILKEVDCRKLFNPIGYFITILEE